MCSSSPLSSSSLSSSLLSSSPRALGQATAMTAVEAPTVALPLPPSAGGGGPDGTPSSPSSGRRGGPDGGGRSGVRRGMRHGALFLLSQINGRSRPSHSHPCRSTVGRCQHGSSEGGRPQPVETSWIHVGAVAPSLPIDSTARRHGDPRGGIGVVPGERLARWRRPCSGVGVSSRLLQRRWGPTGCSSSPSLSGTDLRLWEA